MARYLGSFTFPEGTTWNDRWQVTNVAQSNRFSTSGDAVFWSQVKRGGRQITIEFPSDAVWLTQTEVETIMSMASNPNNQHLFFWDNISYLVYFHHERGATNFVPLIGYEDASDDKFYGSINLITVN